MNNSIHVSCHVIDCKILKVIGLFQNFFVTPLLRITFFRSHTPWKNLIFHHPPLEFHTIFSRTTWNSTEIRLLNYDPPGIFQF